MSQLALYLFGPPRLEQDGVPIHISRRKAMALLVYLVVTAQPHSRDALATLLWPENDQRSARAELRRTLSVLNRTLGVGWLKADLEHACLVLPADLTDDSSLWLDIAEFQRKLKICKSHNHPPTITCPECLPALEDLVTLYTDDFMAGFSLKDCREFEEWQFFQAEGFRRLLTNALVRLSSHYAGILEYETAIQHARRWLSMDPLHEPAHRQLMSLYENSGQHAAALRQYETCREILLRELGVAPSQEIEDLYQQIKLSTLISQPGSRPRHNLPAQPTPFIGREQELAEIRAKLNGADCRLLTLVGPGGSGKTRLAIEVASGLVDDFRNGVFFVNLAPLQAADAIPATIADAVKFSFYTGASPEEQLLDYLGNKKMLLILDNFEHLTAGIGYIQEILSTAPELKILVTSRSRLMIMEEYLYQVMGMAYPATSVPLKGGIQAYSALRLFESKAVQIKPAFSLAEENITDVIRICSLLEGMPLGIILAATWMEMLTPAEIASEIAQGMDFLQTDLIDVPMRHRSMQTVFDSSWLLLTDKEQQILSALSVFRGGFTLEAAQTVAGAAMPDLMGLLHKSMVQRTNSGRFEIHELLRQYAAEKLARVPGFEHEIRDRHSDFYCHALANWQSNLEGPQQGAARQEMKIEIHNIEVAWQRAVERAKYPQLLSAIVSLCYYYQQHWQQKEGKSTCQMLLDKLTITAQEAMSSREMDKASRDEILELFATALVWCGFFNFQLGKIKLARRQIKKTLNLIINSELSSEYATLIRAGALNTLSFIIRLESPVEADRLLEKSLQLCKSIKSNFWIGVILENMAISQIKREDRIALFEESLSVRRTQGDLGGIAHSLLLLSCETAWQLRFQKAEQLAFESLAIYHDIAHQHGVVLVYRYLSSYYVWQGKLDESRVVAKKMLEIGNDLGSTPSIALSSAIAAYPDLYLGEYKGATKQAYSSLATCKKGNHVWDIVGCAHAISIMGKIALAVRSYPGAQKHTQESISIFQDIIEEKDSVGQDLACLGYIARKMDRKHQAKPYFLDALRLAIEVDGFLALFHTLPGIALLFADQGDIERAAELYALASTLGMVANSRWFADIAGDEIAAAAEQLPSEVVEAAKARGRDRDLWETAKELLQELEERGWNEGV